MRILRVPASVLDDRRIARARGKRTGGRRGGDAGVVRAALTAAAAGDQETLRSLSARDSDVPDQVVRIARDAARAGLAVQDVLRGGRSVAVVYGPEAGTRARDGTRRRVALCRVSRGRIREISLMEPASG